jgi:hypothetical protein
MFSGKNSMGLGSRNNGGRLSPYQVLSQMMLPREFCQRWFRSTPEDEQQRGYREKCVALLSKVLRIRENTIQRWGGGIDFERMPEHYQVTLAYADIIREMVESVSQKTDMLDLVLGKLQDVQ